MSGMPLETCSALNERRNNKFYYKIASCWFFLLIHTTMHGSLNITCILLLSHSFTFLCSIFYQRIYIYIYICRSQWPRGLRRRSAAARMLRSWVLIPPGAWMFVCCECCVLSGRGLCDELITRPEESYRL